MMIRIGNKTQEEPIQVDLRIELHGPNGQVWVRAQTTVLTMEHLIST